MRRNLYLAVVSIALIGVCGFALGQDPAAKPTAKPPQESPTVQPKAQQTDDELADEFKRLSGAWKPKFATMAGDKIPDEVCKNIQLDMTPGRYQTITNGVESSGSIQLDLKAEPRSMDITIEDGPEAGKTIKCIYKFEGEELHVAYSLAFDEVRPVEFESNQDNKVLLIVYQHADKANDAPDRSSKSPDESGKK
jgi:uncharacterized protein (TIGR03067 family)